MPKKILRLFLLLGFYFVTLANLSAQRALFELSGKVVDGESQKPLSGATLSFEGGLIGTTTDSLGNYRIKLPLGEFGVKVSYIGFKPSRLRIKIPDKKTQDFALESMNSTLDAVTVSGTSKRQTENLSIGLNTLSIKGVKKLPAVMGEVDILRSLLTLPGITSVGEGANGVNVRGGTVDQNLIYVDDTPIFNPTHLFGLFSVFPADAVRAIELYKGEIPARFGGRIASVMDIKMVEPNTEKFSMNGGIGIISDRLMVEVPIIKDKLSILSAGRVSYDDFLIKNFGNATISGTTASFYDWANKVFYKPNNKTSISFSSYLNQDSYGVDSLFSLENILARKTNFKYGHQNFSLQFSRYVSSKLSYNIVGVMSQYATKTFSDDIGTAFSIDTKIQYKNVKMTFDYSPDDKNRMNFGISGIRYDLSPGTLTPGANSVITATTIANEQSYELGAFVADEYAVSKKFTAELGLRFVEFLNVGPSSIRTYSPTAPMSAETLISSVPLAAGAIESSYNGFEPRLAMKYDLGENDVIKFGYNRMNQFIQLVSNNTTPLPTSRWKTSDRFIKPQTSDFVSLGYFKNFKDDIWEFSAEAYYKETQNLLDYISGANLQLNPTIETQLIQGKGKAYGMELLLSKKKGETTGWISYTYARAFEQMLGAFPAKQELNDGNWFRTDYDKPHTINLMINSQVGIHHSFSFIWTYSTGRPYTAPVGFFSEGNIKYPIYPDRNNDRISDYHRLDFSWTITNPTMRTRRWEGSWIFTVYNLYGHQNAYSYFFKPSPAGLVPYQLGVFTQPFISLAYNFKFK